MVNMEKAREAVTAKIDGAARELEAISLGIHGRPELNFEEHHAHAVLTDFLQAKGFRVERGAYRMPTAFRATAGSGGPRIAVLCEYDALPGIGHACGHNLIAIAGLATGLALKAALGDGQGTVVVLGSPAEEGGGGKIELIKGGAFDGIDAAMMLHPTPYDAAYMNVLAIEQAEVEYRGRNAHAAGAPWEGVNALDAMIQAFAAVGLMRQQILPTDRVHGVITNGGLKPNIIPDRTNAAFYLRSKTREELVRLRKKIYGCFEGAATATGCSVTISQPEGEQPYSDMVHNDVMAATYTAYFEANGIRLPTKQQVLGGPGASTDMGDVSYTVPSIHPCFAIPCEPGTGNHTPGFTAAAATPAAHVATLRAARALAFTALDLYLEPALIAAAREEFKRSARAS
jgi:amidohydrolase